MHRLQLFRRINPRFVFGFNKCQSLNHYSKSFSFDYVNQHISTTFIPIAESLGIPPSRLASYDLHLPSGVLEEVREFKALSGRRKMVVINIFAGNPDRCMSQQQLAEVIVNLQATYNNIHIILLDHRREITLTLPPGVMINPFKTPYHMMALIHESDLVISPDTSIVHISATWQKPLVAIYKNVITNNTLWGPGYDNASQIIIHQGLIHQKRELPLMIIAEIENRGFLGDSS